MTKRNWIIFWVSILIVVAVIIPGLSYLARHGHLSNVTLSNEEDKASVSPASEEASSATPTSTPTATPSTGELSTEDRKKLSVLKEIFRSKNDNDPRMDSELVHLSPELKLAMVKTYQTLPAEQRNERGTIAFLIGREVKSAEDVDFLKSILMEKPCMSLSDCSKPNSAPTAEDVHLEGMNETTANYPQLMALRQMTASYRKLIDQDGSSPLAAGILQSFRAALNSPNPRVSDEARRALQALGKEN